jgi:hypothetical protein
LIGLEAKFSLLEDPILLEISAEIDLVFNSMSRIAMKDIEGWMLQSFKTLSWNWPTTSDQYCESIFVTE